MSKARVAAFSISIDGFGAGPRQDLNNPLGVRGFELHTWFQDTEVFSEDARSTFYFVTDGLESALAQAREAARGKDVRIGGGVSTVRQYLTAEQIDEMHLAVSPVFLGEGEHLFSGITVVLCFLRRAG